MIIVRVFVPFAFGFFISYVYRTVNAVIAPNLVGDLGLDAADLGLLTGVYFLSFAVALVPLGVLLDRFGPRRPEAALLILAALGAFLFATAETLSGLLVARALIGAGVAACLMAAVKAFIIWLPVERRALANGCLTAFGGLGALAATAPVEAALHITDWRGVFLGLGCVTLAAAVLLFLVVPEKEGSQAGGGIREQVGDIGTILKSRFFWCYAPLAASLQAAFHAVQTLWAGPWLRDVAGFDRADVANHLLVVAVAMTAGFVLLGAATHRVGRWGVTPLAFNIACMVALMIVQAAMIVPWLDSVLVLMVLFGFFGSCWVLPFAVLPLYFPAELAGRLITAFNVLNFAGSFVFQWGIGLIINQWPETASGGYPLAAYQVAFAVILAIQLVFLAWFFVGKRVKPV